MSSRTIVDQMEITKEFGMARQRGLLNKATAKAITLTDLKLPPSLKSMMLLRRRMQIQIMIWCLQ